MVTMSPTLITRILHYQRTSFAKTLGYSRIGRWVDVPVSKFAIERYDTVTHLRLFREQLAVFCCWRASNGPELIYQIEIGCP